MNYKKLSERFENMGGNCMLLEWQVELNQLIKVRYTLNGKKYSTVTDKLYFAFGMQYVSINLNSVVELENVDKEVKQVTCQPAEETSVIEYDADLIQYKEIIEDIRWAYIIAYCNHFNTKMYVDYDIIPAAIMAATDFHLQVDADDILYSTDGLTVTNSYQS